MLWTDVKTKNLYKKDFSANSVVELGTNGTSSSAVNYSIIMKSNTAPTFLCGDINGDFAINALDFALLKKYILTGAADSMNLSAANVNTDGSINAIALALMKSYLLGNISSF